jgi:hypothetical protein
MAAVSAGNGGTMKNITLSLVGILGLVTFCSEAWAWRIDINGRASIARDESFAVTVDAAGNVVAAGFTQNIGTGRDFTVIKFDGTSGTELWRQVINGTANREDEALAVAVGSWRKCHRRRLYDE